MTPITDTFWNYVAAFGAGVLIGIYLGKFVL